jgi:5-dehydro-2-deoxygluconokinase
MKPERLDVLAVGRVTVVLYPQQVGVPLRDVETFTKHIGGSSTNVAVAASRLGHRSAIVTKVGDDDFGVYVRRALRGYGVDDRFVGVDPGLHTPVVFPALMPPDDFPLLFYREPKAPDMNIDAADLDLEAVRDAEILWTSGDRFSDEPSRSATFAALEERGRRRHTIHDLDYRPSFWPSPEAGRQDQLRALGMATIAVGNRHECSITVGDGTPEEQASRLLDLGLEMAVVKMGEQGVLVAGDGFSERVPPISVEVLSGLGAGDAFGGALCHGLLEGWDPVETVRFANAAGAYVATRLECAHAMPTAGQVEELLDAAR